MDGMSGNHVFFLLLAVVVVSTRSQCPVSVPTIVSSSSSADVCRVVSEGSLSYTCTNDNIALTWGGSVFSTTFNVVAGSITSIPSLTVSGVAVKENNNGDGSCLNSTLTFTGNLTSLTALDDAILNCTSTGETPSTNITVIPTNAGSPTMTNISQSTCDPKSGNQVTLAWTAPIDTGGQGVEIEHYLVDVTGFTCPPDQCNVTDTTTTITGLQCNTSYSITVRAVNCRGEGNSSSSEMFTVNTPAPPVPSFGDIPCFDENSIRVSLTEYTNSCYSGIKFAVSSNCTESEVVMDNTATIGVLFGVSDDDDSCEVRAVVVTDCGNSSVMTAMTNGTCAPLPPTPTPTPTSPDPTSIMSPLVPTKGTMNEGSSMIIIIIVCVIVGIIVVCMVIITTILLVCIFCPCECCMPCRAKCCGCCSEDLICCGNAKECSSDPTPLFASEKKQPVLTDSSSLTKKEMATGQPSYPVASALMYQDSNTIQHKAAPTSYPESSGSMYQDPNTIQRQAAPTTGDLYAQPDKPARHQKQPATELATYQDPSTIQRQAAPTTGDMYALPEKQPKQPSGQSNQSRGMYADLDLDLPGAATGRRPAPTPDTTYSQVEHRM